MAHNKRLTAARGTVDRNKNYALTEAVALAKEFMQLHLEHMPEWEGTCEVRAFMARPPHA